MNRIILGTAGHIDHGKTALIRALTGRNTDRLPEEQQRGISIDLGFAEFSIDEETQVSIIDVPGHEKFIKNMVAGATGVDAVMLVIAADEGIMQQTREHLDILTLLGVEHGLVVITKTDLVDEDWLHMVTDLVQTELEGTPLESARVVTASSKTGAGIEQVRSEIIRLIDDISVNRRQHALPRLPIDRVFTVRGFGTVVTGTLAAGSISVDDQLVVVPDRVEVRIKNVQVHGEQVMQAQAGQRVAVNLGGVDKADTDRGQVLTVAGFDCVCQRFTGQLRLLGSAKKKLKINERVRIHIGTDEVMARCIPLAGNEVEPGEHMMVRFNLERKAAAFWGDRFIIRSYSPQHTIGGGRVMEIETRRRRKHADDLTYLGRLEQADEDQFLQLVMIEQICVPTTARAISLKTGLDEDHVEQLLMELTRRDVVIKLEADQYVHSDALQRIRERIIERLQIHLRENRLARGMKREQLRQETFADVSPRSFALVLEHVAGSGPVELRGSMVGIKGHDVKLTDAERDIIEKLQHEFLHGGFSPPGLDEVSGPTEQINQLAGLLINDGILIRIDSDIIMHRQTLEQAQQMILDHFESHDEMTVAEARDIFNTSRRYALPLLNYLDSQGLTRRTGDVRVAGRNRLRFSQ